jgi:membrane fusion protein (multidrug efflux system)
VATETGEQTAERVVTVRTITATTREVIDTATLPADLLPLRQATLAAEVPGAVAAVHVEEGDDVDAGELLIEVDTRTLRQRLAEAEAVHRHRQARLDRAEKLLERRSITREQHLDAIAEAAVAEAQLESARLELEKSRVTAPWAGTVASRRVEVGDYVVPGQPVVELLDLRRLKVRAPAPASDVPHLRRGAPAEVRVDAYPGELFHGEVVRLAAALDPEARTLDVEVEIPNPDRRLRPGMYARLEIPRRTLEAAVLVPLEALVELEDARALYLVEDGRAVRRTVTLGPVTGDRVVVAHGLAPGERVIVEGQRDVSPGQPVREAER